MSHFSDMSHYPRGELYNSFRTRIPEGLEKFMKAKPKNIPINMVLKGNRFGKDVICIAKQIRLLSIFILYKLYLVKRSMTMTYAQIVSVPKSKHCRKKFSIDICNIDSTKTRKQASSVKILEAFVEKCKQLYFDLIWLSNQLKVFRIYDMIMCEHYEASTRPRSEFLAWDPTKEMFTMIDIGALLSSVDPSKLVFKIVPTNGIQIYSAYLGRNIILQFEFLIPGTKITVKSVNMNRQCGISHLVEMMKKCEGKILSFNSEEQMRLVKFGGKHVLCVPNKPFQMGKLWYVYIMALKSFYREDAAVKAYEEYQLVKAAEEELLSKRHKQCPGCSNWIQKEVTIHSSGLLDEACNHIVCPCGTTMCFRCGKTLADCIANDARNRRDMMEEFEEYMACQNHNRCPQHVMNSENEIVIHHCPQSCPGHNIFQ